MMPSLLLVACFLSSPAGLAQTTSLRVARPSAAGGTSWYVAPTGSDLNDCQTPGSPCATIGAAVALAAGGDTVYVALGTYTGQDTEVVVLDEDVTVSGGWEPDFTARSGRSVVDGEAARRGVAVASGTDATMQDFVFRNGNSFSGCVDVGEGALVLERCSVEDNSCLAGSVRVFRGSVLLRDSTVRNNQGGAGIECHFGSVTLERCSVLDHSAQGIGLESASANASATVVRGNGGPGIDSFDGDVVLHDCTIEGNSGGLLNFTGAMRVERSTITGNSRFNFGGILNLSGNGRIGRLTLINTTVSGNTSVFDGGGIFNSGALSANNCTITANSADDGGGIYLQANPGFASLDLRNTIVAGNSAPFFSAPDCGGGFATYPSGGHNLIGNTRDCPIDLEPSDVANVAAHLGPLADNGGPTLTHRPLPDSPAIEGGNPAVPGSEPGACEPIDQRGVARPIGLIGDIGAFEAPMFLVTSTQDSGPGSLRQALLDANAAPGADLVRFAIPGAGPHVIRPLSDLPPLAEPALVDGFSQPGSSANTRPFGEGTDAVMKVVLNGQNRTFSLGLLVTGGNSTVRGLVIQRFTIPLWLQSDGNVIEGNFIGTDATGMIGASNGVSGVEVESSDNRIGGTEPRSRNVLSFNLGNGIRIWETAKRNRILGNFIGTNAAGTAALGNQSAGIDLRGPGTEVRQNLISGNGSFLGPGIEITGNDSLVVGNYIGTDVTGTLPLGNRQAGIDLGSCAGVRIGMDGGPGNVIAFNVDPFDQNGSGISVRPCCGGTTQVQIASTNSIHSNEGLGIDLRPFGVNPNDEWDRDADAANDGQNYPVLSSAVANGTTLKVTGLLEAHPAEPYRIEFFRSSACDPSGSGEGETSLGGIDVQTDEGGRAPFTIHLERYDDWRRLIRDGWMTATATDLAGHTSEFSPCVAIAHPMHSPR